MTRRRGHPQIPSPHRYPPTQQYSTHTHTRPRLGFHATNASTSGEPQSPTRRGRPKRGARRRVPPPREMSAAEQTHSCQCRVARCFAVISYHHFTVARDASNPARRRLRTASWRLALKLARDDGRRHACEGCALAGGVAATSAAALRDVRHSSRRATRVTPVVLDPLAPRLLSRRAGRLPLVVRAVHPSCFVRPAASSWRRTRPTTTRRRSDA